MSKLYKDRVFSEMSLEDLEEWFETPEYRQALDEVKAYNAEQAIKSARSYWEKTGDGDCVNETEAERLPP